MAEYGDLANDEEYARRAQIGEFECPACGKKFRGKVTLPATYNCDNGHDPTPVRFLRKLP